MILASDLLSMQRAHALIIGDVMLDLYVQGAVTRISPEAPVPVLLEESRRSVLGGAANVAANISAFGAKAYLLGRVGSDEEGSQVIQLSKSLGINVEALHINPHIKTTRKMRVMAAYQQLVRIDSEVFQQSEEGSIEKVILEVEKFINLNSEIPKKNKVVVISDYGKGFLVPQMIQKIIELCKANQIPVVADPKSLDLKRYNGCTILKPNLAEAREMAKAFGGVQNDKNWKEEAFELGHRILKESQCLSIAMSLSERGVIGFTISPNSPEIVSEHHPSYVREVADVSGAGDTMVAFLALGAAVGIPFNKQLEVANAASGLSCSKLGTATVSFSELMHSLKENSSLTENGLSKHLEFSDVPTLVNELRKKGQSIVFTNGCFDILHAGHVRYLKAARQMGNILVVAVNSDDSIKRLKGHTRPIQTLADRLEVLAGLACVDFVISFHEDTPINLIRQVKPDFLVKGSDYAPEKIVGYEELMSWGGKVAVIPLYEGRSTSRIVSQVKAMSFN